MLNGKTATAVALMMFNVATAALNGEQYSHLGPPTHLPIAGVIVLGDNSNNSADHTVVGTITAVLWSLLVVFPFVQVMFTDLVMTMTMYIIAMLGSTGYCGMQWITSCCSDH